jgi:hypothetical protein
MAKKAMREQDETPRQEARSHSPEFLKKAARLAGKRKKSRKGNRRSGGRR